MAQQTISDLRTKVGAVRRPLTTKTGGSARILLLPRGLVDIPFDVLIDVLARLPQLFFGIVAALGDFLLEFFARLFELAQALAHAPSQFGKFLRSKKKQQQNENDGHFRTAKTHETRDEKGSAHNIKGCNHENLGSRDEGGQTASYCDRAGSAKESCAGQCDRQSGPPDSLPDVTGRMTVLRGFADAQERNITHL